MKKHHPDVSDSDGELAKEFNEAYSVLSDKNKKTEYDLKFLDYQKRSHTIGHPSQKSYISKRYELQEKEDKLRDKEEQLLEKEKTIQMKLRVIEEFSLFIEKTPLNQKKMNLVLLAADFAKVQEQDLKNFKIILQDYQGELKDFVQLVFSKTLSMDQELFIFELILDHREWQDFDYQLENAFRYKPLYMKLFEFIHEKNLKIYFKKIDLIVKNLLFKANKNLLPVIFKLYLRFAEKEELLSLLFQVELLFHDLQEIDEADKKLLLKFLLIIEEQNWLAYFKKSLKKFKKIKDSDIQRILEIQIKNS
jgi:curved DNA-binding protein CbpA